MLMGLPNFTKLKYSQTKIIAMVLLFGLTSPLLAKESEQTAVEEVIYIDAIDWCPQICLDPKRPGYVVELVKKIFENTRYQLKIKVYPWSRAIKNVSSGRADALLSPAKSEAPNLLYPKLHVGYQQMCFFTRYESNWRYDGINSLEGLQIGIAADTSIEELNDYVKSHPWQFQFQPYHERYLAQNIAKLEKGRMDTFLFTKNSTLFALHKLRKQGEIKEVGCVSKAPIYMAFTPVASKAGKTSVMMSVFNRNFSALKKTHFIKKLMASYHLPTNS